jgi:hypothetical protein
MSLDPLSPLLGQSRGHTVRMYPGKIWKSTSIHSLYLLRSFGSTQIHSFIHKMRQKLTQRHSASTGSARLHCFQTRQTKKVKMRTKYGTNYLGLFTHNVPNIGRFSKQDDQNCAMPLGSSTYIAIRHAHPQFKMLIFSSFVMKF